MPSPAALREYRTRAAELHARQKAGDDTRQAERDLARWMGENGLGEEAPVEDEPEPAAHPHAGALFLAMFRAAQAGDEAAVDHLAELATDRGGLDDLVADIQTPEPPAPPPPQVAESATSSYAWAAATSRSGGVMAVGAGEHAGQKLYGKRAEEALRAQQKHAPTAEGAAGTNEGAAAGATGTAPAAAGDDRANRTAARLASFNAARKALDDPAALTPDELAALPRHLKGLSVAQMNEFSRHLRERHGHTISWAKKGELAAALHDYVKTRRIPQPAKPRHVTEAIAESAERTRRAADAVNTARAAWEPVRAAAEAAAARWNDAADKLLAMDGELWATHKLDMQNPDNIHDPRAAAREKFRLEVAKPALFASREAWDAETKAREKIRESLAEALKPPAPQKIDGAFESSAHGGDAAVYPTGFREIPPEQRPMAEKVYGKAAAFVQGLTNGIDGAKVMFGTDAGGRAWAAKKGRHYHGGGADYVALISQVPAYDFGLPEQEATAVHELGHVIEFHKPGVYDLARQFLDHRCAGESPTPMSKVVPRANYGKDELGRKDRFDKVFDTASAYYVGKVYFGASEVVSMGLEQLYKDPAGFAEKDPEYFGFMVHVLTM
jgi:hypothetical protein